MFDILSMRDIKNCTNNNKAQNLRRARKVKPLHNQSQYFFFARSLFYFCGCNTQNFLLA